MGNRFTSAVTLAGFLGLVSAITFALHRLGEVSWLSVNWPNLRQWLSSTPPDDALLAASRMVGLACGWWIICSTLFYLAARWSRASFAMDLATPLTIPFIRTLGTRLLVGTVAAATLGGALPAAASTDRPAATREFGALPFPVPIPQPGASGPGMEPLPPAPFLFPHPVVDLDSRRIGLIETPDRTPQYGDRSAASDSPSPLRHPTPGSLYRVSEGDNLWKIAHRAVTQAFGHPPNVRQTACYWVDLIEANRETIRSGDPDLIFPEETILLPPARGI